MSLALSLCQYVLRPRRGLGQASPSLEAPRFAGFGNTGSLSSQHIRNGKILTIKVSRYIELVLGSFSAPETDMSFGDGVGASLVRGPYCQLSVFVCVTLMRFARLKKVLSWA